MGVALDAVLQRAESEVKYWGGDGVGLLHLAIAVARESPEAFDSAFGPAGLDAVKSELVAQRFGEDGPEAVDEVIACASAAPPKEAVSALATSLRERLEWVFTEPAGDESDGSDARRADQAHPAAAGGMESQSPQGLEDRQASETRASDRFEDFPVLDRELTERSHQVDELIVVLARRRPCTPLLVGREGSGRTTLISALATRLSDPAYSGPLAGARVLTPEPELLGATNLAFQIAEAAAEWNEATVVVLEDLERLLDVSGMGMDANLMRRVRPLLEHPDLRLVLSIDESLLGRLESYAPEFRSSLTDVEVGLKDSAARLEAVCSGAADLAAAHGVELPHDVVEPAAEANPGVRGPVQPGLGISILDSACVRALQRGSDVVEVADLASHGVVGVGRVDHDALRQALCNRVVGQDHVAKEVSARLALTKAGLDLRPERPDGVFLFVGPTGVGKTEMARALSEEVFGSTERMIRLDMSEYVHDWAISRLIGPQPGFLGSTEPGSWLTTRVAKNPHCVLLLDEIEKAHPLVWNTFLQVFDAGRLTDSRGETVDFSDVVVIMTSNLGADAYSKRQVGFGAQDTDVGRAEAQVNETIRRTLSPELLNRLDNTLLFRPLEESAIREIAEKIVDAQVKRIAALGIRLRVDSAVVEHLAATGYDPAFGARHLQRNVDRELLVPLALAGAGSEFKAHVSDSGVAWTRC